MGEGRANPTNPLTLTLVQGSRLPTVYFDPKHSGATNALEHADHHSITHPSYPHQTVTVQHGLNRNAGPFTAFSVSYYRTSSHTPRHHGPPAVATREHAPQVWPQATYKGTISIVVGCWKDFNRDKSERSQCEECTRRPDGSAASVGHKTQAQRM